MNPPDPGTAPGTLDEDQLKQYVADELERGRDPQHRADHRRPRRERAAGPTLPADVAAGVGPRPRRQLRGALAAARGRRHRGDAPELDDIYDAFEHPRADPADPAAAPAPTRPATTSAWSGARCSTRSTRSGSTPTGPLLEPGFVYGMVLQHEHQHDETMLATHQLRRGDPVLPTPPTRCRRRRR